MSTYYCGWPLCRSPGCVANRKEAAMKQETMPVPVELVRELKSVRVELLPVGMTILTGAGKRLHAALDALPEPPKPDVVDECSRVAWELCSLHSWDDARREIQKERRRQTRATLRRYRELLGLEPDPELAE